MSPFLRITTLFYLVKKDYFQFSQVLRLKIAKDFLLFIYPIFKNSTYVLCLDEPNIYFFCIFSCLKYQKGYLLNHGGVNLGLVVWVICKHNFSQIAFNEF